MIRSLLLACCVAGASIAQAQQLPIVDYGFLAEDPNVMVNKVIEQPDGKILVAGSFQYYAGTGLSNLVRLNADGTLDTSFNPGGTGPGHVVHDIALMDDGRIIVGGVFSEYNEAPSPFVIRLLPNGTRDYSFEIPPNTINSAVLAVAVHYDDKVIAAGEFFICYGHSKPYIVRFNSDGSLDESFDIGTGFSNKVRDVLVLPDLRILCTGDFSSYNGNPCGHIALLSQDGPYDPSMNNVPGLGGYPMGITLEQQPDGKILVGGYFTHHQGVPRGGISRVHLNGDLDTSFDSPFYPYAGVTAIAVREDGSMMVGGEFTQTMYGVGQTGPNRLVRLHANGTWDESYELGQGLMPNPGGTCFVRDIEIQSDSKILVGGHFVYLDTEDAYQQLIRLQEEFSTDIPDAGVAESFFVHRDATGNLYMSDPFDGGVAQLAVYSVTGALLAERQVVSGSGTPVRLTAIDIPGIYMLVLQQGERRAVQRLAVE